MVSDEAERGTLLYLFTRPIPKPAVVLGYFATYAVIATVFLAGCFAVTFGILATESGGAAVLQARAFFAFVGVLLLGWAYAVRKGALKWQ